MTREDAHYIRTHWGMSKALAIAIHLGVGVRDVYRAAQKIGVHVPERRPKFTKRIKNRIVKLHSLGMSDRNIATELDVAHSSVTRLLRSLGLVSNGRQWKKRTLAKG